MNDEKLVSYKHTLAVILKLKESLLRIMRSIDILSQILFILFYVYCLVTHLDSLPWTIVYSCLIGLSSLFLFFYVFTFRSKNKSVIKVRKVVRRATKYTKFLIRGAIIGYNIYLMCTTEVTELNKLLVFLSIIMLVLQITLDISIIFANRYIDLFLASIKWDFEESLALQKVVGMIKEKDDNPSVGKRIISSLTNRWLKSGRHASDDADPLSEDEEKSRKIIQDIEDNYLDK